MQIFCSKAYTLFYSFIILNLIAVVSTAQTNSPYSRYGIGDLMQQENIPNIGMGGVSNAYSAIGQINYLNPASYTNIYLTTLQAGFNGERNRITTKDSFNTAGGLNVSFLSLGLPIGKNGGAAFGIMPESRVSYRALSREIAFDTTELQRAFYGSGGIQKFFVGYGHKIKDFNFGVNVNFLFGNYNKSSINQFFDTLNIYSSEFATYNSVNGINFLLGGIYQHTIKSAGKLNGKKISIGATWQPQSMLNVVSDGYKRSFIYSGIGADSIETVAGVKSKMTLPMKFGTGIMLANGDIWKIGLDYNMASWSNYRVNNEADSTSNTWSVKLGGAYRQSFMENTNYLRRIEYRAGIYTAKEYLRLNSTDVKSSGVTFGLGLPLKIRSSSYGMINLAFNTGIRGTIDNGLVREGFTRFTFGINLSEKWFRKQRYD
jgi:hypothetical protein